jgi:carboxymethylenebutenolidase
MGKMIEFARPDGQSAPGYLTGPDSGAPGVVMIQEWWGATDYIKETADQLASAGFRVLVPDLYRGRSAAVGDEANHLMEGLDFGDAATQDVRGAAQFLKQKSAKVGVVGFCMGGALTVLAAMFDPEFDAAVSFYGIPPAEAGDPSTIKIPFMGHWATEDEFFPIANADQFEKRIGNGKHVFHRYDARHAFHNPNEVGHSGLGNYDATLASLAWERTVNFFKANLA